ncbi:MAG: endo-1,4-beta-xylanase, partial [Candidatus Koribacter versatilis]|nr:endo-1,4-beta-xylanase [Candidatus Koribacter versatilis]
MFAGYWKYVVLSIALAAASPISPSLRASADRGGILVGTAVRPEQFSEPAYAATLAHEFNLLEPEDAMKWEVLHPAPETFDFTQADRIVAFAAQHNMKVRGHTLVWHQQNPKWLTEGRYTADQLAQILEKHVKTVVGHYRGKVFAWDVVNEAFDERVVGKFRRTIWY